MALSSNNRLLIIAEKADKPTVSIWDLQTLRKKRTLIMSDSQSKVNNCENVSTRFFQPINTS